MKRNIRLSLGLLFVFFAAAFFFREESEPLSVLIAGGIALGLLYREVFIAAFLLWRALCSLGKRTVERVKRVDEMRHCKCCGGPAVYLVTTCVPKPNATGPIPERKTIFVCREHHPNPDIGTKAEDLHAYIRGNIHPAATDECVFPHNPY